MTRSTPTSPGRWAPVPFPAMVAIHHAPGWDEWYRECTRKFAHHGYVTISPNLYFRDGHGTPEDVGAKVRAGGGIPDEQVLGDLDGANKLLRSLPYVSGKVGVFGTCSGGRHGFLAACRLEELRRAGGMLGRPRGASKEELTPKQPVAPIDYTKDLSCPMIGIFGNDDKSPSPEQVNLHEAELEEARQELRVSSLRRRRPRLFLLRPSGLSPGTSGRRLEKSCSPSARKISSNRCNERSRDMCTMIAHQAKIEGRGKSGQDWFEVREANVSYDHPYDLPLEHALNIDFVNEAAGPGARVAVELSVEAARKLVQTIEAVLAQAEQRGVLGRPAASGLPARSQPTGRGG